MNKLKSFYQKWYGVLAIIIVSILAYGLLIPWLGFYMDDWTFTWAYKLYGSQGLFTYFSLNRPFWGLTYQLTMPVLKDNILAWHIFGLVCRIITSLSFYWLVCLIWPRQKKFTLYAGLLFAVYPGFLLQTIALCFGHIWLVFTSFLLSNCFTILAIRRPSRRVVYTILAVLLSLYNMLSMEYFLTLEALRWLLLFYLIIEPLPFWKRLGQSVKLWAPYLAALIGVGVYRVFFYKGQTYRYSIELLAVLKQNLGAGILLLGKEFVSAIYQSTLFAWVQPFLTIYGKVDKFIQPYILRLQSAHSLKAVVSAIGYSSIMMFLLVLVALIVVVLLIRLLCKWMGPISKEKESHPVSILVAVLFALLLAGIPFYLTSLPVEAADINSRFTLPFMLGAAMFLAYLLNLLPVRWLRVTLLSLIVAVAILFQLNNAYNYHKMSIENRETMYEIWWRSPSLKPGTLVITNERTSSKFFTPSTMRTELNLIYPHDASTSFGWDFATDFTRLMGKPVPANTDVTLPMFVIDFKGNTNSAVVFQISDDGCARFVDSDSTFFSKEIIDNGIQKISNKQNLVNSPDQPVSLDNKLIGPEPAHGWCYYFEKTDLAIQLKDYASVEKNYKIVTTKGYKTLHGYEWFPYVEGLADAGDWKNALDLSQRVISGNPDNESYQPILCQILTKVQQANGSSSQSKNVLDSLQCSQ
jgi:hypothetical protein